MHRLFVVSIEIQMQLFQLIEACECRKIRAVTEAIHEERQLF